jgi:predicted enzyme related to lactoylglutathione lyase
MAHRSRLSTVIVDVPHSDRAGAVDFWTGAFGRQPQQGTEFPEYHWFGEVTPGVIFMVQGTGDDAPRTHLDIETDDVEAEVDRLTKLGATEVSRAGTWVVMRDPVGTIFCVVRVQVPDAFDAHATRWE